MDNLDNFRTESVTACPLCRNSDREVLYSGLTDVLHGTPGEWAYARCYRCKLVFLDPRPIQEEIGKAYTDDYGTHSPAKLPDNPLRRLRSYIRKGYLAKAYGYTKGTGHVQRLVGWLAHLHPGQRDVMQGSVMFLHAGGRGRLLDVGCGAGEVLSELSRLGWEAKGVDPDQKAVENAVRKHGLDVKAGTLDDLDYPSEYFDAVISSHVIEHVHDPVGFLGECWRILKPGGLLIVATPNAESLGSRYFGPYWRVLEPPRHLTVFSTSTLAYAAGLAGVSTPTLRITLRGADGIFTESRRLRLKSVRDQQGRLNTVLEKMRGHAYQYALSLVMLFDPAAGEELLMVTTKNEKVSSTEPSA